MAATPNKKQWWAQLLRRSDVQPGEEDEKLMLLVKNDDQRAFQALYDKYKTPIYSYLYHFTQAGAQAQELAQETFLRVYRNRKSYEPGRAKFTTWLWTIARHLAIDSLRKKGEVLSFDTKEVFDNVESHLPTAETLLVEKADKSQLEICVGELAPNQREAIILRVFSEFSYEQIATQTKQTLSSVKSLIYRAKKALLDCIQRGHHG